MFEELLRLLREFGADETLIALVETAAAPPAVDENGEPDPDAEPVGLPAMADEDLDVMIAGLRALGEDEEASAALLGEAADAVGAANGEVEAREEAAEAEEAERQEAIARLNGEPDETDPDADAEGDTDGDGEPAGDVNETDPTDTDGDTDDGGEGEGAGEGVEADELEAVAAAAPNRQERRAARRAARRRQASHQPATSASVENRDNLTPDSPVFTFLADSGQPAGSTATSLNEVDRALGHKAGQFGRTRRTSGARSAESHYPVAEVQRDYPAERQLFDSQGRMLPPDTASERISAALGEALGNYRAEGLPAAGGLCAPAQPIYTVMQLGSQRRPIRDSAVVTFQAPRGSVVSVTPPSLPQVAGQDPNSIGIWTMANDEAALDDTNVRKSVARVECGEPIQTEIAAITHQLIIGNILDRTFPEYVGSWSGLTMLQQDRVAENRMFEQIVNSAITTEHSAQVTKVSAVRDILGLLDLVAWNIRTRHRLDETFPFRAILPESLLGVMALDLSRGIAGGSVLDQLMIGGQQLRALFAAKNINVTWSPDILPMDPISDGTPVPDWPAAAPYAFYPEGSFLGLDAGVLDLGIVRDNELNKANDHETFAETFEAVHPIGVPGTVIAGEIEICPSGAAVGTLDPAELCAGS